MAKILVYTFRGFPWQSKLREDFPDLFVFGKLKEDYERFCEEVKIKKPDLIIGIAKGRRSIWEGLAVNKFNSGTLVKGGEEFFNLYIPSETIFPVNQIPWTTFCNWTAYKIQNFLIENNLHIKLSFLHIKEKDLPKLKSQIRE